MAVLFGLDLSAVFKPQSEAKDLRSTPPTRPRLEVLPVRATNKVGSNRPEARHKMPSALDLPPSNITHSLVTYRVVGKCNKFAVKR